jgi:hypothetical protein
LFPCLITSGLCIPPSASYRGLFLPSLYTSKMPLPGANIFFRSLYSCFFNPGPQSQLSPLLQQYYFSPCFTYSSNLKIEAACLPECHKTFTRLQSVTSQKAVIFRSKISIKNSLSASSDPAYPHPDIMYQKRRHNLHSKHTFFRCSTTVCQTNVN